MKTLLRGVFALLLLFTLTVSSFASLAGAGSFLVAYQAAYGTQGTITVANSGSLPAGPLTPSSFVAVAIPYNCGSVTFSVNNSYTGQLHVYTSTGSMGAAGQSARYDQENDSLISQAGATTSGVPANTGGTFTCPARVGTAYIVASSLSAGTPFIVALPGPVLAGAQVGSGVASSANQTNGNQVTGASWLPWQPATWNSSTTLNTALSVVSQALTTATVTVNASAGETGGQISCWATDGTSWIHLPGSLDGTTSASNLTTVNSPYTPTAGQTVGIRFNVAGYQAFKISLTNAISAGTITINMSATFAGIADRVVVISGTTAISATSLPLPTGASTAANQTANGTTLSTIAANTTGVAMAANQTNGSHITQIGDAGKTNTVSVMSGTTGAATSGNALLTAGSAISVPFSVTASGDISATSISAAPGVIKGVVITFSSIGTSNQVQMLQSTNAWSTNYPVFMFLANVVTAGAQEPSPFTPVTAVGLTANVFGSSFKLNVSTYTSGTIAGVITYFTTPMQTQPAVPTTYALGVGSAGSAPAVTTIYQNGALSNTPIQVKAGTANVYTIRVYNPNASGTVCVELFNTSPTLGTTVPFDHFTMGASTQPFEGRFDVPSTIASGTFYIVCVTTYNGSSAPSTGVDVSVRYQ